MSLYSDPISISDVLQAQDQKIAQLEKTMEGNNAEIHEHMKNIMQAVSDINKRLSSYNDKPAQNPISPFQSPVLPVQSPVSSAKASLPPPQSQYQNFSAAENPAFEGYEETSTGRSPDNG